MSKEPYVDKYCKTTPSADDLAIKINEGEIPVWPGVFHRMKTSGYFASSERDANDPLKVTGRTEDGDVYVSQLTDDEMTDEEFSIYCTRKGINVDKVMSKFSNNIHTKNDRPKGTWSY